MTASIAGDSLLDADPESTAQIRSTLDEVGLDAALQALRPDYFTAPYPNLEELGRLLPALERPLAVAIQLLSMAAPLPLFEVEEALGREFIEAGLMCGLLAYHESMESLSTNGYSVVSRFGQYFAVSINPYYPTFDPAYADVYMGPDSFSLAHELQRRRALIPAQGQALDLCAGSGIAGLTATLLAPELLWTGLDVSVSAIATANFNANLNALPSRYRAVQSDLYGAVGDARFDFIVANPPFIPVPDGLTFPGYGAGGEDGLLVLAPMLLDLPAHLSPDGSALIYAEGIGSGGKLLVDDLLAPITATGRNVELTVIAEATIDNALYTLGVMLAKQRPSRLAEIVHWRDLFSHLDSDTYAKFFLQITPGEGRLVKRSICPDPRRLAVVTSQVRQDKETV